MGEREDSSCKDDFINFMEKMYSSNLGLNCSDLKLVKFWINSPNEDTEPGPGTSNSELPEEAADEDFSKLEKRVNKKMKSFEKLLFGRDLKDGVKLKEDFEDLIVKESELQKIENSILEVENVFREAELDDLGDVKHFGNQRNLFKELNLPICPFGPYTDKDEAAWEKVETKIMVDILGEIGLSEDEEEGGEDKQDKETEHYQQLFRGFSKSALTVEELGEAFAIADMEIKYETKLMNDGVKREHMKSLNRGKNTEEKMNQEDRQNTGDMEDTGNRQDTGDMEDTGNREDTMDREDTVNIQYNVEREDTGDAGVSEEMKSEGVELLPPGGEKSDRTDEEACQDDEEFDEDDKAFFSYLLKEARARREEENSKNKSQQKVVYQPKRVEVMWADPLEEADFGRELLEFTTVNPVPTAADCPTHCPSPGLDRLVPLLPRDILKILTRSEEDIQDWEYSISLEKGELSDEDEEEFDSEFEEELCKIKTRLRKQLKKKYGEGSSAEKFFMDGVPPPVTSSAGEQEERRRRTVELQATEREPIDVRSFLHTILPSLTEDIIGTRDGWGEIDGYVAAPRAHWEMDREYDRLHFGMESESETEDEQETEDDVEEKMQEIEWDDDQRKSKNFCLAKQPTEAELRDRFKEIQERIERAGVDEEEEEERDWGMKGKVASFLERLGLSGAGRVGSTSLDHFLEEQFDRLEPVFRSALGRSGPPPGPQCGIDPYFSKEDELKRTKEKTSHLDLLDTIVKSPAVPLSSLYIGEEETAVDEVEPEMESGDMMSSGVDSSAKVKDSSAKGSSAPDSMASPSSQPEPPVSFQEEEMNEGWEIRSGMAKMFPSDSSSSSEDGISSPSESEEDRFDKAFREEYFRRGGTTQGLGASGTLAPDASLETLDTFSNKYLTAPYYSSHSGEYNFVRMRRYLAQYFPEFATEAFADLSKMDYKSICKIEIDSESSSECSGGEGVASFDWVPEPWIEEEVEGMRPEEESAEEMEDDEEVESGEYVPFVEIMPFPPQRTLEDFRKDLKKEEEEKRRRKEKRRARRGERERLHNQAMINTSEEEEAGEEGEAVEMVWAPVQKLDLSHGSAVNSLATIKKIVYPRKKKFKPPRKLIAWIKGGYEPTKDDLERFKRKVHQHFGERSILEKVISQEKKDLFEKIREETKENLKKDGIVDSDDEEWKNNHPLIKLKRYIKTRNKKLKKKTMKETGDSQEEESNESEREVSEEREEEDGCGEECENSEVGGSDEGEEGATKDDKDGEEVQPPGRNENLPDNVQSGDKLLETREDPEIQKTPIIRTRIIHRRQLKKEEWAEEVDSGATFKLTGHPAMSFPFQLDGFQKQAIQALEGGYNVFVSAHTSAGKTVVAEYAIAMSKRNRSKAVYTSPVKALSNQKYADFKRVFGSVGLITGDIQLNETAECLIMTTEILRSMLYNSSEKIRDLEFVVFDEVHYINDPERGHVWEEVLILLPSQVQIVMLSATVPNTMEFANWVGRTKQRKVMVCGTSQRPVPLQHYLYTGTGGSSPGETYLIKNGDGPFILNQYYKAEGVMKLAMEKEREFRKKAARLRQKEDVKEWKSGGKSGGGGGGGKGGRGLSTEDGSVTGTELEERDGPGKEVMSAHMKREKTMWIAFVSFLQKRDWLPTVVFVFSRKMCDNLSTLLSCEDLTTKSEKSFIHRFIKSQVEKLDILDQDLPQIQVMQQHLLLGIGVHHSGILPVMKEIVEVLFQEGKVKLLFATETFAMGVNMPARTVVFHSIKKFDGCQTRLLLPAEYVQMAGRAGRRGKDSAGNVIIRTKPDEIIDKNSLEQLMFGNPSRLTSRFRLSYRMILNTLTMSGMISVQLMMARSYCENQGQLMKRILEKDLAETEKTEKALKSDASEKMSTESLDELSRFYELAEMFGEKWSEIRAVMLSRTRLGKELVAGRLIQVSQGHFLKRTGMILDVVNSGEDRLFRVLLLDQHRHFTAAITPFGVGGAPGEVYDWYQLVSQVPRGLPPEPQLVLGPEDFLVLTVRPVEVVAVCRECIKVQRVHLEQLLVELAQRIGSRFRTNDYAYSLSRHLCSLLSNITLIDEKCLSIDGFELKLKVAELWSLEDSIKNLNIEYSEQFIENFLTVFQWKQKEKKMKHLQKSVSYESMKLYPDLMNKLALLKYKQYISDDEENTVLMKGFMAARVGKYELIVCELLVENVLEDMEPEEVAALLSFLVYQSGGPEDIPARGTLPPTLVAGIERCEAIIRGVTELEKSFAIEDYEGSDTAKLKFGLVHIMYAWAKQKPFKEIMEMTVEFQEGMLVRWIQQLLETLKEVEAAARVMGDPGVPTKLQQAGQSIKRGIVFAPSLYTTLG